MKHRLSSGFTLIELVVTVAIVALLASAAMPVVELVQTRPGRLVTPVNMFLMWLSMVPTRAASFLRGH